MPPFDDDNEFFEYDEDRGGSRTEYNRLSFRGGSAFHQATKNFPVSIWERAGDYEDEVRYTTESIHVESLLRRAPVTLTAPNNHKVMTRCLSLEDFTRDALKLLVEEGLLEHVDDDGTRRASSKTMTNSNGVPTSSWKS